MSRRHANNWSHPGHYLVDPYTWPWHQMVMVMVLNDLLPPRLCNINRPSQSEIQLFQNLTMKNPWSRSCVWSKVQVTFDLQNSKVKVMIKVKPIGHIWGLEFNRYVCFSFRSNRTTVGWDIGNAIFNLENSTSRSWPRSKLMVIFEVLEFNRYVCFSFRGNRTFFWLRYSKSYIWPWKFKVKVMAKVKSDGHIWALEFNRYLCFSFSWQ